jgi:integrase
MRRYLHHRPIERDTFASVIRTYLASETFRALAPETQRTWKRMLHIAELPDCLGAESVDDIRPALVQAFLDGLSHKPGNQHVARTALKAVERYALVRDLLHHPICTGTVIVGSDGGHEPWTDAQVALAEQHARPDVARAITLAVSTGQRGSDVVRMRPCDVEVNKGHPGILVRQKKTDVRLWVPFLPPLIEALASWDYEPGSIVPFILRPNGKPHTRQTFAWHWYAERIRNPALASLNEAGLVMHGLRATAVVRLRKAGLSVLQVCDIVGMSESMVSRYCRLADKTDRAISAIEALARTSGERRHNW